MTTKRELKKELDSLNIEYPTRASKSNLVAKLKQAKEYLALRKPEATPDAVFVDPVVTPDHTGPDADFVDPNATFGTQA
jgi:hypothetical protein